MFSGTSLLSYYLMHSVNHNGGGHMSSESLPARLSALVVLMVWILLSFSSIARAGTDQLAGGGEYIHISNPPQVQELLNRTAVNSGRSIKTKLKCGTSTLQQIGCPVVERPVVERPELEHTREYASSHATNKLECCTRCTRCTRCTSAAKR